MKSVYIVAFCVLAVIQWLVPGKLIRDKNQVFKRGALYKFKTEPIDPSHPFKGRYIILHFAETSFTDTINRQIRGSDPVFVILSIDQHGFARASGLSVRDPRGKIAYVKAVANYSSQVNDSITVHFQYPFDEFYMDEFKAPKAETIYREATRDSLNTAYALVRIYEGDAIIENIFINNVPIGELIK